MTTARPVDRTLRRLRSASFVVDAEDRIAFVDMGWEILTGVDSDTALGTPFWSYFPDGDLQRLSRLPELVTPGSLGRIRVNTTVVNEPDALPVVVTVQPSGSDLIGFVDIRTSANSAAFDDQSIGIWEGNLATGEMSFSPAWHRMLGLSPSEAPATFDEMWDLMHDDDSDVAIGLLHGLAVNPDDLVDLNVRFYRPDGAGEHRWYYNRCCTLETDDQGRALRVIGTSIDLDARTRAQQRLRDRSRVDAAAKLGRGIAHDFNHLLAVIVGHAEAAQTSNDLDEIRRTMSAVGEVARRATAVTQRLSSFARNSNPVRRAIDVSSALGELKVLLEPSLAPATAFVLDAPPEPMLIMIDRQEFDEVVLNVAINARDAMPDGGTLTWTAARTAADEMTVTVADTGRGMDDVTLNRLFEPFYSSAADGRGAGVGMVVVAQTMDRIGGRVAVKSRPGIGTEVSLVFPLVTGSEPDVIEAERSALGLGRHALVVDDQPDLVQLTADSLRVAGFDVAVATTGFEARRRLADEQIDVIVVNEVLADGTSGLEFAEDSEVACLVMSAMIRSQHIDAPTIPKPFTRSELLQALAEVTDPTYPPPAFWSANRTAGGPVR